MKVVTADEMRNIDRLTIEEYGLPGSVLMGFAGRFVAAEISRCLCKGDRVLVCCGKGNNGGDGYVIAYFLLRDGINVEIISSAESNELGDTSRIYYNLCLKSGVSIKCFKNRNDINAEKKYSCIIDAVLGTGIKGKVKGIVAEMISVINEIKCPVYSVDIPSGLPAEGRIEDISCVVADKTFTIGLPKFSLVTYPGKRYCGEISVIDIGFPVELTHSDDISTELVDKRILDIFGDSADQDLHKGNRGHILLVGGMPGMEGAMLMCAKAVLRIGTGLITLVTAEESRKVIAGLVPELMTCSLKDIENIEPDLIEEVVLGVMGKLFDRRSFDVLIIGPGLGRGDLAAILFVSILKMLEKMKNPPVVLVDGDGLYHFSNILKSQQPVPELPFLITPHFGEAGMILDRKTEFLKADRIAAAEELVRVSGATVLLKGPCTLVRDNKRQFINTSGNPALATGGSGDVLSGIIAALLLRNKSIVKAAAAGAFMHGKAADDFVQNTGRTSLKATDIIDSLEPI